MARWRVDIIRKRAEHLGTVEAPNESEAILEAIKRFEIPPDRQNRITVEKMTKNKDHRPCLGPVLSELPCGFFGAIERNGDYVSGVVLKSPRDQPSWLSR